MSLASSPPLNWIISSINLDRNPGMSSGCFKSTALDIHSSRLLSPYGVGSLLLILVRDCFNNRSFSEDKWSRCDLWSWDECSEPPVLFLLRAGTEHYRTAWMCQRRAERFQAIQMMQYYTHTYTNGLQMGLKLLIIYKNCIKYIIYIKYVLACC